jgi:hypothetical protein
MLLNNLRYLYYRQKKLRFRYRGLIFVKINPSFVYHHDKAMINRFELWHIFYALPSYFL